MIRSLTFGTRQLEAGTTRVLLRPGERLVIGLGATAESSDQLIDAQAYLWTNINESDPRTYRPISMAPTASTDGHQRAYEVTLPPANLGTYVISAYLTVNGEQYWADTWYGNRNLVFRVKSRLVESLYVRQVPVDKANARAGGSDISTLDDMMGDLPDRYSLAKLAREGVNCVWVEQPYRIDLWDGLPPVDDAGSDYASTDWFSVDPELSVDARQVPQWDLDLQRELANDTMRRFVDEAHALGMAVLFGIAPNHVGHNFIFRDDFGNAGSPDVRRRDYSQVVVSASQLDQVAARLAARQLDERVKDFAEYVFPQLYAGRASDGTYNPNGANGLVEMYSPDWYGLWADTKHLNHGGHAGNRIWEPRTQQNWRILYYLARVLRWSMTDLGADGFRIDHALGMPYVFFEVILPLVEAEARAYGKSEVLYVLEDHDRKDYSARVCDVVQSKGYEGLLHALTHRDVDALWEKYNDPYYSFEFVGTGNHDEVRGSTFFPNDLLAYGNAVILMQLLGGPMTMLAGDEYGESEKLRFKARGGVSTIWQNREGTLPQDNIKLSRWIAKAGLLKRVHPALQEQGRERLRAQGGQPLIVAAARYLRDDSQLPLLVFGNLSGDRTSASFFDLGSAASRRIDASAEYQCRDRLSLDDTRPLWRSPMAGSLLLEKGLYVELQPYQIQVLELGQIP